MTGQKGLQWEDGYARENAPSGGTKREYAAEARQAAPRASPGKDYPSPTTVL